MRSSPLLLKDYFTTQLTYLAKPNFDLTVLPSEGVTPDDLLVDVQEGKAEGAPRRRSCHILVSLKEAAKEKFPYEFNVALVGFFEIIPEWPEGQVDALFSANAPALLYSAAREVLALMTGRGPYPKLILPSVTFVKPPPERSSPEGNLLVNDPVKTADAPGNPVVRRRIRRRAERKPDSE